MTPSQQSTIAIGKRIAAISLLLLVLGLIPLPPIRNVSAQTGGGGGGGAQETPFGGQNNVQIVCTCTGNIILYIEDYRTNQQLILLYQPGLSILYETYNVFGKYLLGTYGQAKNQCEIGVAKYCITLNVNGQLGMMPGTGTSN